MIGMGTASLDAASVGLPSIIVSAAQSFSASELCRYRWLFESKGFSTGEFVELGNEKSQVGHDFEEIIDSYLAGPDEIKKMCVEYVKNFHEEVVFEKLSNKLLASQVSLSDIASGLKRLNKLNVFLKSIVQLKRRIT